MSAVVKAKNAWGINIPDWVIVMAEACDYTSQKSVAGEMRYSPAVVNCVLGAAYKGDLKSVKQAVEGALLSATVDCPVVGELKSNKCMENQRLKYASTNALRVRLFKACNSGSCTNSRIAR